jgi:D-alanyl-D-alanine carboxypeptidase/D-alanyl-D-alanine-endopeptidase (penicillin-binding protein 4)
LVRVLLAVGAAASAWAATPAWGQKPSPPPTEIAQALERLKIPADALSVVILDPQRPEPALWQHRPEVSVNPASLMKLVTTTAALDLLGPAFTWNTPVYVDGPIKDGVLQGNVYLRGQGDPRLVVERLWLLLRRLQAQGVARIQGDIVLDRSAFALAPRDPASFDGEPLRPYNAAPDALLINFKSIVLGFVPDAGAKLAMCSWTLPWPVSATRPACPWWAGLAPTTAPACAPTFKTPSASACWATTRSVVVSARGPWPMPTLPATAAAPWPRCGNSSRARKA